MSGNVLSIALAIGVHLWQATLVGAALVLLARGIAGRSPSLAHWTLRLAVVKFAIPTGLMAALLSPWLEGAAAPAWIAGAISSPVVTTAWTGPFANAPRATTDLLGLAVALALSMWLGIVLVRLGRLSRDLWRTRIGVLEPPIGSAEARTAIAAVEASVASAARRAGIRPDCIVLTGADVMPSVVGLIRPRVIVPIGLARTLTASELEAVLAHEAAHCRRRDPIWMFVTRAVEAVFGLHPLVHWISRRLSDTAEMACDDAARDHGIPSRTLARALAKTVRHGLVPSPAALAVTGSGDGVIARRLDRLRQPRSVGMTRQRVAVALAALCVGVMTVVPLQAETKHAKNTDGAQVADVVHPKPITMVAPDYPKDARDVEGKLYVQVTITASGEMQDAEVTRQDEALAAHGGFAENALAALAQWTFEPGRTDGKPTEMTISIPFAFKLDGHAK